jgi:hypothetical protein
MPQAGKWSRGRGRHSPETPPAAERSSGRRRPSPEPPLTAERPPGRRPPFPETPPRRRHTPTRRRRPPGAAPMAERFPSRRRRPPGGPRTAARIPDRRTSRVTNITVNPGGQTGTDSENAEMMATRARRIDRIRPSKGRPLLPSRERMQTKRHPRRSGEGWSIGQVAEGSDRPKLSRTSLDDRTGDEHELHA